VNRESCVVCIVGAGPAGLVLGHLLARAQVPYMILERLEADGLRARTKAGLIEQHTVELLEPYGLADPIIERGTRNGVCEFRADGEAFVLDYGALTDSPGHFIYPQHELVADWAEQLLSAGGEIRFGTRAVAAAQDENGALVSAVVEASGEQLAISCEAVAVCDGGGSELAGIATIESLDVSHPFRWLAVIASAPPATPRTVYGLHPRGFAGQMRRSAELTRYMLEIPANDGLDEWPDARIWAELQDRLAVADRPSLQQGELIERDVLDLRVRVREPMQAGRVFLAGDAAHLITPAGGKGMNLAIQDAVELASGLCELYGAAGAGERLARYSETRLPVVWRYQEFSNLMLLGLMHAGRDGDARFAYRLRRATLERVIDDPQFSRWFAHAYAGSAQAHAGS